MSVKAPDKNPHELFEKLRSKGKQVVLLENGWGGGAWSFVGVVNEKVKVPLGEKGLVFIRDFLRIHGMKEKRKRVPFTAGFVGFLSYELGAKWQGVKPFNKPKVPDTHFVYVDTVYAFKKKFLSMASLSMANRNVDPRFSRLSGTPLQRWHRDDIEKEKLSKKKYFKKIAQIKEYLRAGETYQVNFSQQFTLPYDGEAFSLYKKLTKINPSPFQFFLETPTFAVVSNSPEKLFSLQNNIIETRPIKGTVSRGTTSAQDRAHVKKLLQSEKDAAELAMIVDLERNDIGKIAQPGSVRVVEARAIEKYSHVIHTVATIRGKLEKKSDWLDALYALFPGGSVTGCPKKRTMEIIHKLEKEPRGVYCGSAGFIDISGEAEFNIMIRTLMLDKSINKHTITFRSGGGIVADSEAELEYKELLSKAQAIQFSLQNTNEFI